MSFIPSFTRFVFCLFMGLSLYSATMTIAHAETDLKAMRLGEHPDKTRLVLELSKTADFRSFALENPYRVVIDIPALSWQESQIIPAAGNIKALRMGSYTGGITRLVIDVDQPTMVKSAFLMPASQNKAARLVVDMASVSPAQFLSSKSRIHGTLPPPQQSNTTANSAQNTGNNQESLAFATRKPTLQTMGLATDSTVNSANIPVPSTPPSRSSTKTKPLIMLDAGHGGIDSGAVNGSILEKEITISMVRTLRDTLEKSGRYRVQLTRDSDVYLKLHQRVALTRRADADLFISIHADSIRSKSVRGASIYTLSNKSSDKQTARLAARENKADTISGIDLSVEDQDVASILIDLSMRETMNQSKYFANSVVEGMEGKGIDLLSNPHRYAGFAVLKAPDIPSVLLEIGFVSNKNEARRLLRKDHQKKLADGILKGVDRYFATLSRNAQAQ